MACYLDDKPRVISYTMSAKITVGHRDCELCGVETPEPTHDQLVEFAKICTATGWDRGNAEKHHGGYLWPGPSHHEPQYLPAGWRWQEPHGLICGGCAATIDQTMAKLKKPKAPK